MTMSTLRAFVILSCISSSAAFLFLRSTQIARATDRAINDTCLRLAGEGSCDFYTCFEHRLPCGRDWYMVKYGQYYCDKSRREKVNFSPEGQQFLDDSQRCLTLSLVDLYKSDYIDCQDLENAAISTIAPCYTENAFCDIFEEDASHFFDVYDFSDLFTRGAGRVWRLMVSLAARCGNEALRELASDAGESVIDAINSAFDSLSNSIDSWENSSN